MPRIRSQRSSLRRWKTSGVVVAAVALTGSLTNDVEARGANAGGDLQAALDHASRGITGWERPSEALRSIVGRRIAGAAVTVLQAQNNSTTTPAAAKYRFAIPSGTLNDALREFSRVTGIAVTLSEPSVGQITVEALNGELTAEDALARLINGTSLSARLTGPSTAVIQLRTASESVRVTGAATEARIASPKYASPVVETPQTIQVIPRTLIEEQGATTLTEALRSVPGITMQAGEGGGASGTTGDMFNMRGFSAANSLFVDGVRDDGLLSRDVFNLEQVEVYSGPTGSDVGRTNAAGYINMTTKQPGLNHNRSAALNYGSNESVRTTFDINQPLSQQRDGSFLGGSALRLNALWQDGGVAGRDYVQRDSKSFAPSIAFGLDTPTRVILSGQVMRQNNIPDYGLPAAASPIGPLTATGVVAPTPVKQTNFYGNPDFDYDKAEQNNVTLRLEHDLGPGAVVRNQMRYNNATREAVVTAITGAYNAAANSVTAARQGSFRKNDILSNQTSLSARATTGRIQHSLNVGFEVSREHYHAPGMTGFGTNRTVDVNNPDVHSDVVGMDVQPTGAKTDGSTDTVAVYLFDGFDLGSRVRVDGGLRVERYDTRSHGVSTAGVVTDLGGDGTLVSGKLGLVYRLSKIANVYVSYGSSLTPPGSTNFQLNAGATNQNNPNVDPQVSRNYEAGTKLDLAGGRLLLTGAVFRTDNTNVIFVVDSTAVPPIFNQDDGQRVTGGTIALVGQITPRWDVNVSLQYLSSRVRSQNANTNNHRLALTPPVAGSIWTTYRLPHDVRVGGGVRYTDAVYISTANTTRVPSYAVADAVLEVPVHKLVSLRLNVYNITDKVYVRSINNNGGRYNPGTPRSFLLATALRF